MTCIKTGARVFLPDYNLFAPADLYRVGTTIIVRFNGDPTYHGAYHVGEGIPAGTTHVVQLNDRGDNFIRFDLGVVAVEESAVTNTSTTEVEATKVVDAMPERTDMDGYSNGYIEGWNTCRLAMLATAPKPEREG